MHLVYLFIMQIIASDLLFVFPDHLIGWLPKSKQADQDAENPDISESQDTVLPKNYATIYDFISSILGIIYGTHP